MSVTERADEEIEEGYDRGGRGYALYQRVLIDSCV